MRKLAVGGALALLTQLVVPASSIASAQTSTQVPGPIGAADQVEPQPPETGLDPRSRFHLNDGQFSPEIDAAAVLGGAGVSLVNGHAVIDLPPGEPAETTAGGGQANTTGTAISIGPTGADPDAQFFAPLSTGPTTNYLIGDTEATGVIGRESVIYRDLLPGVDVRYRTDAEQLTYDLLLDAGTDPASVTLSVAGAASVAVNDAGRLVVSPPVGDPIHFSAPVSYQLGGNGPIDVASRYRIVSEPDPQGVALVAFEVDGWDENLPLVIDPTLDWDSYAGGSGDDTSVALGVDSNKNVIVATETASVNFPTTAGAYQTDQPGTDVVVSKFSADGTTLLWSTYVGGDGADIPTDLTVDSTGRVVVVGSTTSTNFSSTGGYDTSANGGTDGFVLRLAADGASLSFGTYLGGTKNDIINAVDLSPTGQIVVAGQTASSNYPVTVGSFDTTLGGASDMVVSTLSTAGNTLVASTFFGGGGAENAFDVAVDSAGVSHLVGTTTSTNMATTASAYDTTANGGVDGAYVEISADATSRIYSTYLGGTGDDTPAAVAVNNGNPVLAGSTQSTDFPTTPGALSTTNAGGTDAWVAGLDRTQTGTATLAWSTYYGGSGNDTATALAVDYEDRANLALTTTSSGLATPLGNDSSHNGGDDGMIVTLASDGSAVAHATYAGGTNNDSLSAIVIDGSQFLVVAGVTNSSMTMTGYDQTFGGGTDGWVQRYNPVPVTFTVPAGAVVVNSTRDLADSNTADGICSTGSTNSSGDVECTLRAAIAQANATGTLDTIVFDMPSGESGHSAGVWTITIGATALPTISAPLTIDGGTQSGFVANTNPHPLGLNGTQAVYIDGNNASNYGLVIGDAADGSIIQNLAISGFNSRNIELSSGADQVTLSGTYVGMNPAGTVSDAGSNGIYIGGSAASIGGRLPSQRNLISGSSDNIRFSSATSTGSLIQGNLVGTKVDGLASAVAVGNATIVSWATTQNVTIGTDGDGIGDQLEGNVIGGATYVLYLRGPNNVVAGNLIGLNRDGDAIGTQTRFVITSTGRVGTNLDGISDEWEANTIANLSEDGITVNGSTNRVAIVGNSIFNNGQQGIDLDSAATATNDPGDGDTGPNNLLNHPEFTSVIQGPATVTVNYKLDVPAGDYAVELFTNPSGLDPSGKGEGENLVGRQYITHTGSGAETFTIVSPGNANDNLTSTATLLTAGVPDITSEFSASLAATCTDADGDGLCNFFEDANTDADDDPATNPSPDTDADGIADYLDADDDNDGIPTVDEKADPNGDGRGSDAFDEDRDGAPDYRDRPNLRTGLTVSHESKISDLAGGLTATLPDGANLGYGLSGIGDIDGDGVEDLITTIINPDGLYSGKVLVLRMNANGTVKAETEIYNGLGGFTGTVDTGSAFGRSTAAIGDLDGDGISEVLVGARSDSDGVNKPGAVYILFLNSNGTVRAHKKITSNLNGFNVTLVDGTRFGFSVAGPGDMDGDGIPDIAVGAHMADSQDGDIFVLFLNADGTVKGNNKIDSIPTSGSGEQLGWAITAPGDIDGDGVSDLVAGTPNTDGTYTDQGSIQVMFMNANGTVRTVVEHGEGSANWNPSVANNTRIGYNVGSIGDLDNDGTPDLVVYRAETPQHIWLLLLNPDGSIKQSGAIGDGLGGVAATVGPMSAFGMGIASLGDLDGDGYQDLAVGTPGDDDGGSNRGAVYILNLTVSNTAPVLDNTGAMSLATIDEDSIGNSGNSVAAIIASAGGDRITDLDGDPEGLVVEATTEDFGGWWEFMIDGVNTWERLSAYHQLLPLRSVDRLRYVPGGYNDEAPTLTVRAWDQTLGTAGEPLRNPTIGGGGPVSAATETVTLAVTAVADNPTFGVVGDHIVWDRAGRIDQFQAVAEASDGSYYAVGWTDTAAAAGNDDVLVVRFNSDGTVDQSFGDAGSVLFPVGAGDDRAYSVAVQSDGAVVVGGTTAATNDDVFVARLTPSGELDTTFGGGDGIVTADSGSADTAAAVMIQSDGRIVLVGGSGPSLLSVRFSATGVLDSGYGTGGIAVPAAPAAADGAIQSDNKVVVAITITGTVDEMGAARLTTSGGLDTSFDSDGIASSTLGLTSGTNAGYGIAIAGDGDIIVTGKSVADGTAPADSIPTANALRLTSAGALETAFGNGGWVRYDLYADDTESMKSVVALSGGELVIGGAIDIAGDSKPEAVLARLNATGSLVGGFGDNGLLVARTGPGINSINHLMVASNGQVVGVGVSGSDGLVARYNPATGASVVLPTANDLDASPTYYRYTTAAVMDSDVRAYDRDLVLSDDWSGTSLTIARQGGADPDDSFSATGVLGALTEGSNLVLDGVTIGTVTTNSAGTLQLSFSSPATSADVRTTLQLVAYSNTVDATGTRVLDWTLSDGSNTAVASVTIDVQDFVLVVNDTGDAGDQSSGDLSCDTGGLNASGAPACTLRAALDEFAATGGGTINFNIPLGDANRVAGPPRDTWTITPATALPTVANKVVVDATTQPGWASWAPVIAVDGSSIAGSSPLIDLSTGADDAQVLGLALVNSGGAAIRVQSGAENVVLADLALGVAVAGGSAPGNSGAGAILRGTNLILRDSVISGNTGGGVVVNDGTATLTGNRVGTDLDGTGAFANTGPGVTVISGASAVIGGIGAGQGNLITNSTGDGIEVAATAGTTTILSNSIFANGGLGIDLGADGVTVNDGNDADTGPNDLLNYPQLTAPLEGDAAVSASLDVPAGDYRVDIFTSVTADPSGYGEGQTHVASGTVTKAGSGSETFVVVVPSVLPGAIYSATVTVDNGAGGFGASSEFSAAVTSEPGSIVVQDDSARRSDLRTGGNLDPATAAVASETGSALALDGSDDVLTGPSLNITSGALTLAARVKPASLNGTDTVVAKKATDGSAIYSLVVDGTTGEAVAEMKTGGVGVSARGGSLASGIYYDLSAIWTGSQLLLYVDGVQVSSASASGVLATEVQTNVTVGNDASGATGFDGAIDLVMVEHRAQSATEIGLRTAMVSDPSTVVAIGSRQASAPGPWTASTGQSRSGSYALAAPQGLGSGAWATVTGLDEPGVVYESWWWSSTVTGVDLAAGTRTGTVPTDEFEGAAIGGDAWRVRRRSGAGVINDGSGSYTWPINTWIKVEMWTDQDGNTRMLVDGTEVVPWKAQGTDPTSGSVGLRAGSVPVGQNWYIDDVRVRHLVFPEPTATLNPIDLQ